MTNYNRGRDFEWEVRAHLLANGYDVVIRSAGSKTKIDLVAFKPGEVLLVQCKRDGYCLPAERTELFRLAGLINAVPLVAVRISRPRIQISYRRLTGPDAWQPWTPEYLAEVWSAATEPDRTGGS